MVRKSRRNKYMKGGDFQNPRRRDWHAGSDEPHEIAYRKKRSGSKTGWFAESDRHSKAAKKGWRARLRGRGRKKSDCGCKRNRSHCAACGKKSRCKCRHSKA